MENGCLEREVTSFPPGNVIPGYDQWDGRPHLGGIVMCQSGGVYQPT